MNESIKKIISAVGVTIMYLGSIGVGGSAMIEKGIHWITALIILVPINVLGMALTFAHKPSEIETKYYVVSAGIIGAVVGTFFWYINQQSASAFIYTLF